MTNPWGQARRLDEGDAAERAAIRDAQHAILADLLAAYADGELPAESAARVEAHLVGCARCRRELAGQIALRERLAAEVVLPAPTSLRDRIVAATAALPAPAVDPSPVAPLADDVARRPGRAWRWRVAASVSACLVVASAGTAAWWHTRAANVADVAVAPIATATGRVPLLAAAVADYRRATAGDLPGRARDLDAVRAAVGFPVEPLRVAGVRLVAAWTTTLDGEAAAVLAYRYGDRLLLHYLVPESLYFRHSALRAAATAHRPLAGTDGAQVVLAWPEATAGALLVSDGTPDELVRAVPALLYGTPSATGRSTPPQTTPQGTASTDARSGTRP